MPPPLDALAAIAELPDGTLSSPTEAGDGREAPVHFVLYDLLRHEQTVASAAQPERRSEIDRILDLAQAAYGEPASVRAPVHGTGPIQSQTCSDANCGIGPNSGRRYRGCPKMRRSSSSSLS